GADHPIIAVILTNLANISDAVDDPETACALLERAIKIYEQAYGVDHPLVARALNDIGCVRVSLGDEDAARICFDRALRISESGGLRLLERTIILNNLGSTCEALGDFSAARKHLTRASNLEQRLLGRDHPRTAITRNNLASVLATLGEVDQAREHLVQALLTDEMFYGPDHARITLRLNNLAAFLHEMGDWRAAKVHAQRALSLCEAHLDPRDPVLKIVLENIAKITTELGYIDLAEAYQRRAEECDSKEMPDFLKDRFRVRFLPVLAGIAAGGTISQRLASGNMTGLLFANRKLSVNSQGNFRAITGVDESDNRLILKIRLGPNSDEAFRLLFERYSPKVRLFFYRRGLLSLDESEDLTQEVFISALRGFGSFRGDARFQTWLFGIAANTYRNELRRQSARKRSGYEISMDANFNDLATSEASPEENIITEERLKLLQTALEELPLEMRQLVTLYYSDGLTYNEIALHLGISIETLKSRLGQARQVLMKRLGNRKDL